MGYEKGEQKSAKQVPRKIGRHSTASFGQRQHHSQAGDQLLHFLFSTLQKNILFFGARRHDDSLRRQPYIIKPPSPTTNTPDASSELRAHGTLMSTLSIIFTSSCVLFYVWAYPRQSRDRNYC
jgi:hypothetical protein